VHREKLGERTVSTLLKLDDDLTQDKLVLQLLSLMDLDMRIYQVLPIEVVPNAVTITTMQIADGTFVGTLSDGAVKKWLIKVNGGHKILSTRDSGGAWLPTALRPALLEYDDAAGRTFLPYRLRPLLVTL
jgi:hypothetical protein